MHLPQPGTQWPLEGGDGGLWIWPGLGLPLSQGDPLFPQPTQEPLCFPGCQDPETPKSPVGCLSGCTSPQSSQLQPEFSDGEIKAQRGGEPERSCSAPEASLGPRPPAHSLIFCAPPPTLSLPRAAAGTVLGIGSKRKGSCPSGQEGHWEWPQQAAYLARDLRLTLR